MIKIKQKKGNRQPRTEKQLEAIARNGTKRMLTKNPMKDPEVAKRVNSTDKRKETSRRLMTKINLTNNPAKNPEILKRRKEQELKTKRLIKLKREVLNE